MKPLTRRQREVLDFILSTIELHGSPPTQREICTHFGFRSTVAAYDHLVALHKKGAIVLVHDKTRNIRIPGVRWQMVRIGEAAE